MINLGGAELLAISLVGVVPFALMMVSLLDATKHDATSWVAAGQNRALWLVLIVLIGCLGPILYLIMIKPTLESHGRSN